MAVQARGQWMVETVDSRYFKIHWNPLGDGVVDGTLRSEVELPSYRALS